jgi:hypothetical protein
MDYRQARIIRNKILRGRPLDNTPPDAVLAAYQYLGEEAPVLAQEPALVPIVDGYESMPLVALKETARVLGLTGYSRLNKSDLIRLLQAQEQV